MERSLRIAIACVLIGLATAALPCQAQNTGQDKIRELEQRIAELERTLEEIRAGSDVSDERIGELERAIEVLSQEVEDLKLGDAVATAGSRGSYGLGPAASKVYRVDRGVSIGGYGEMLYERFDDTRQDGQPSGRTDQLDYLRAVLYFGYKFSDRILFNSEIEYEHATTSNGDNGSVSVEFAYLDFFFKDLINARAGMVLVPMGFINELHEPPIFLGARRPYVEQVMIPTTWRANGAGIFGENDHFAYRAYVHTTLDAVAGSSSGADGFTQAGVRDGRSKGSKAPAEDLAVSARFDWTPVDGLLVGVAGYHGDAGQGATVNPDGTGGTVDATTTILDVHFDYRWRGLQARGVWVDTTIDDVTALNAAQTARGVLQPGQSVGEDQFGWYAELGYDVFSHIRTRQALIPYVRYERFDTQESVPEGFTRDLAFDRTVLTTGVAWKPITQVVLKADYNRIENEAETGVDQFNVALGFMF